jgi:hypothetical protein
MKRSDIRLAINEESISPVTILDGLGRVVRVVPADVFRRNRGPVVESPIQGGRRRRARSAASPSDRRHGDAAHGDIR